MVRANSPLRENWYQFSTVGTAILRLRDMVWQAYRRNNMLFLALKEPWVSA